MAENNDTEATPARPESKSPSTKTMFELTKSMVDKAVGVVVQQSEESDKRVADAYEKGLDAVVRMVENQADRDAKREATQSKRNFRIIMAFVAILGAVAMGASALKFFGVFEIGNDATEAAESTGSTENAKPRDTDAK